MVRRHAYELSKSLAAGNQTLSMLLHNKNIRLIGSGVVSSAYLVEDIDEGNPGNGFILKLIQYPVDMLKEMRTDFHLPCKYFPANPNDQHQTRLIQPKVELGFPDDVDECEYINNLKAKIIKILVEEQGLDAKTVEYFLKKCDFDKINNYGHIANTKYIFVIDEDSAQPLLNLTKNLESKEKSIEVQAAKEFVISTLPEPAQAMVEKASRPKSSVFRELFGRFFSRPSN